jgi:hypothetical protein
MSCLNFLYVFVYSSLFARRKLTCRKTHRRREQVALCRRGLPLIGSKVINVYQKRTPDKGIVEVVKERKNEFKKL